MPHDTSADVTPLAALQLRLAQRAEAEANAASSLHSLRTHLRDKQTFARQWDHERLKSWKKTQVRATSPLTTERSHSPERPNCLPPLATPTERRETGAGAGADDARAQAARR